MFDTSSTTGVVTDIEATQQNLTLLLLSEKEELFGDPFFGVNLKKYLFDQNDKILRDILIDEIYSAIAIFIPQLMLNRSDIVITEECGKAICKFKATNREDFKTNLYNIALFDLSYN